MSETTYADTPRGSRVLALIFWIVSMVLGFLDLVALREVGLATIALTGFSKHFASLADKVIFFLFGVAGLAIIILSEAYYRKGAETGRLAIRFLTVSAWQLLAIAVCGLFLRWVSGLADAARTPVWVIVGALTLCAIACVLRRVSRKTNVRH